MGTVGKKTISASVGLKGVNRYNDVVSVQRLLNDVPPNEGCPQPKLAVDGIAGPNTNKAIQTFQLRHFGWHGADGRVDPGGPTLAKLNSYQSDPASSAFAIQRVGLTGDILDPNNNNQWFFRIRNVNDQSQPPARYYLGKKHDLNGLYIPVIFFGTPEQFNAPVGQKIDTLSGNAVYSTIRQNWGGGTSPYMLKSTLNIGLSSGLLRIDMRDHIALPPPYSNPIVGGQNYNAARARQGSFILL